MINRISPRSVSALVLSLVAVSGCTTSTHFVDYQEQNLYSGDQAGGMNFVEIGPATASAKGYVWESCESLQEEALQALRKKVDGHGANTVLDVRWVNHSEGSLDDTPLCTTGWGWFAGAGVAGLGPWVKATEVRGKLAYMDASARSDLNASAQKDQVKRTDEGEQESQTPAPEADSSDEAGDTGSETTMAADEADKAEEAATTESDSASESSNPEAAESPDDSGAEAQSENDTQG